LHAESILYMYECLHTLHKNYIFYSLFLRNNKIYFISIFKTDFAFSWLAKDLSKHVLHSSFPHNFFYVFVHCYIYKISNFLNNLFREIRIIYGKIKSIKNINKKFLIKKYKNRCLVFFRFYLKLMGF